MDVLVAPDSFKGSLHAQEAASAIARGWRAARPNDRVRLLPQADGGEGTLEALAAGTAGPRWRIARGLRNWDGRTVDAQWLELPGAVAAVELARTCGIETLESSDPMHAGTEALGELIARVVDAGPCRAMLVCLGGSASTDGGAGALRSLGLHLRDSSARPVGPGGAGVARVARADTARLRSLPPGGVTLLVDTDVVLCGAHGAARVFGPQKGADDQQVAALDAALRHFADMLARTGITVDPERPGCGAAGGTAFGLASWGARIALGSAVVAETTGLDSAIASADLVITGEGSFDRTSLTGKVTGELLRRCVAMRTDALLIAGRVEEPVDQPYVELRELAGGEVSARADAALWLRRAARRAAAYVG